MITTLFIFAVLIGIGFLVWGYISKKVIFFIISTVLFFALSIQSFNIEFYTSSGTSVSFVEPFFLYFCLGMGFISTIFVILASIQFKKQKNIQV